MTEVYHGSGNVFEDIALPDAAELHAKSIVSIYIERIIDANRWTQTEAAKNMGLTQPDVSNILRGKLTGFTLDRLFSCLNALNQDVEIRIQPSAGGAGRVFVSSSL